MNKGNIIREIEEVASSPGFLYALAILVRRDLFFDPAEIADASVNYRDRLNIQELTLLIGLMVKHKIDPSLPSEAECEEKLRRVLDLFEKLHEAFNEPWSREFRRLQETPPIALESDRVLASGDFIAEPMFYGAQGAYDFQYMALAEKKFAKDIDWLLANKGFSVGDVLGVPVTLKYVSEQRQKAAKWPSSFEEFCETSLKIFTFSRNDLAPLSDELIDRFLETFALTPGTVNRHLSSVGQYNSVASHPIIALGDDRFFVPINFLLTESLYESPFYWMLQDSTYRATAAKNRGVTTEDIAYEMLQPIFDPKLLLRNVTVQKSKKERATDIDILAVVGNKAIVFQIKSKRLTELARQGDTDKLKHDFQLAIQAAYDQALVCREAILSRQSRLFDDKGNEVRLSETIDEVYIVCLTSDDYPALGHQIETYLTKQSDEPYPIGMSLFDLDVVAFYLQDPFDFAYYLRQRSALSGYFRASSEMAFLGYHLRHKLFRASDSDFIYLDDQFAQLIDANFPVLRGQHTHFRVDKLRPDWKNRKFERLLQEVKATNEPRFTDAIFFLLDLSGDGADWLIRRIEIAQTSTRGDGTNHDFSMSFGGGTSGLSFLAQSGSPATLGPNLMSLALARKYKTQADSWLGLGSIVGSGRMVDAIAFSKQPWEFDQRLEEYCKTALKPSRALGPEGRKIGRNDPCPCGKGKKWKKCCGRDQ